MNTRVTHTHTHTHTHTEREREREKERERMCRPTPTPSAAARMVGLFWVLLGLFYLCAQIHVRLRQSKSDVLVCVCVPKLALTCVICRVSWAFECQKRPSSVKRDPVQRKKRPSTDMCHLPSELGVLKFECPTPYVSFDTELGLF